MSIVQLLNVNELNNTFDHSIDFPDIQTQTKFFEDRIYRTINLPTEDDYVYVRENRTIEVDINKNELLGVNYLRFNNGSKWWYACIIDKQYINESVTSITFEIDVFQTFMFDYQIEESYVTREHQDRFDSNLQPIFNLREESLDLGDEYIKESETIVTDSNIADTRVNCLLIVAGKLISSYNDGVAPTYITGPTNKLGDPLQYYLIPFVTPSRNVYVGSGQEVMSAGRLFNELKGRSYSPDAEYIGGTYQDLANQLTKYADIISFSVLPYFPFDYTITKDGNNDVTITAPNLLKTFFYYTNPITPFTIKKGYAYHLNSNQLKDTLMNINVKYLLNIPTPVFDIHTNRNMAYETKLYSFPYNYLTLDCDQTEPLVIKPQYLDNLSTKVKFNQCIGPNAIVKYYLENYKGDTGNDTTLINNTLNDLNVYTNKLIDYLAQNKASATSGLAVNTALDIGVTALRTGIGVAGQNPFAISNAISDVKGVADRLLNENFKRQDLSQGSLNYKAKGNNAYAFYQQYGNYDSGVKVRVYSIAEQFKRFAYNFFYHYGYKTNDFKIPNLKSRYYFNYIQIPDINILTKIDNEYIQKLKSIYSNGITIWHYRDEETWLGVDNYTYENVETNLIGV